MKEKNRCDYDFVGVFVCRRCILYLKVYLNCVRLNVSNDDKYYNL